MDGQLFSLTALNTQIGISMGATARELVYACLAGALIFHICASRCFPCCHSHYLQPVHSCTWLRCVVCIDSLPDRRRNGRRGYKGWRHPIVRSWRSSTSTGSSTKDCARASAPATQLCNLFTAARDTSFPPHVLAPNFRICFPAPVVSFDALLLHHPLPHRSRIYSGVHWHTYVYMGWHANVDWYILYRLLGCQCRCGRVGDCYVASTSGVSIPNMRTFMCTPFSSGRNELRVCSKIGVVFAQLSLSRLPFVGWLLGASRLQQGNFCGGAANTVLWPVATSLLNAAHGLPNNCLMAYSQVPTHRSGRHPTETACACAWS